MGMVAVVSKDRGLAVGVGRREREGEGEGKKVDI